jgi:RNA polymerase sigma factor (TIGR02999 family)
MSPELPGITGLLHRWRDGDRLAEGELFEIVLPELRRIARRCMARERPDHTLQPTELIGEVYGRLIKAKNRGWQDRAHFFSIVARTMRRYLIDYARSRRPGDEVALDEVERMLPVTSNIETATLIDGQLEVLSTEKPEWCSVVELKYFLGLTDEETAAALNIPVRTAQRNWHDARRWLFERLNADSQLSC